MNQKYSTTISPQTLKFLQPLTLYKSRLKTNGYENFYFKFQTWVGPKRIMQLNKKVRVKNIHEANRHCQLTRD